MRNYPVSLRSRVVATAVAIAAVALGSAVIAIAQDSGDGDVGVTVQPAPDKKPPPSVSAEQTSLAVLRGAPTKADAVPDNVRARIHGGPAGENADLGKLALTVDGVALYVVPAADDLVCLHTDSGSGACDDATTIARGGFHGQFDCPNREQGTQVVGMLPDSAETANLRLADGTELPLNLANNVYSRRLSSDQATHVQTIEWSTQGGTAAAPLALDAVPKCAVAPPGG